MLPYIMPKTLAEIKYARNKHKKKQLRNGVTMNLLDAFNNLLLSILLVMTFTFFTFHLTRELPKNFIKSIYGKLFLSCAGIIISFFILHYAIIVPDVVTVIDLCPLILLTFYYIGGFVPTIVITISQVIIEIIFRGFGLGTVHLIIRGILFLLCFYYVDKVIKKENRILRWYLKLIIVIFITTPSLYLLLKDSEFSTKILLRDFTITVTLASSLQFYLLESIRKSNELYFTYKKDSTHDFLTGLLNTRALDATFHQAISTVEKTNQYLSCLMIDIYFFKKINDTYGHYKGDLVLKELSNILMDHFGTTGTVGRIGGEEFCVLLQNYSYETIYNEATKVRTYVEQNVFHLSPWTSIHLTISIGIASFPEATNDLTTLKQLADKALYDAKNSGRNKVCTYSKPLN